MLPEIRRGVGSKPPVRSFEFQRARTVSLWRTLLAVLILASVAPSGASAARSLYVSSTAGLLPAFSINADGSLTSRGVPGTGGSTTEGVAISPDAKYVYVANYLPGSGSVAAFQILSTGSISALSGSPFTSGYGNPLGLAPDPNGGRLFAWNHGVGSIAVSAIAADGSLGNVPSSPFAIPAGQSGPFGGSVAPDGQHVYVPNENSTETVAGCAGTCEVNRVTAYSVAANGTLSAIQSAVTGTTNVTAGGPNPFGSAITPNGKFLYVSNPNDGANGTISGFAVNSNGTLTALSSGFPLDAGSSGKHPLDMAISPDGARLYVATTDTGTVNAYSIAADGSLSPISGQPFPTGEVDGKALALTPDGKRLYVASNTAHNVTGFNVAADGSLTEMGGSPFGGSDIAASPDLESIAITPDQPPTAAFEVRSKPKEKAAKFDGSASSDSDGSVAGYVWHFGDGKKGDRGPITHHRYQHPGLYTVTLKVTDNEGCSSTRIFTGRAMLCNGSSVALTTHDVIARKLSIKHASNKFKGKLVADLPACQQENVHVFRKRKGDDRQVGVDHTDGAGKWRVPDEGAHGTFYAQAIPKQLAAGTRCLATRSETIKIG